MLVFILGLVTIPMLAGGDPIEDGSGRRGDLPTIVLINSDDQRFDTLQYMPHVREDIVKKGINFKNSFVVNPVCCPSRAALLSGTYSHTNGVYDNNGANGGFRAFNDTGSVAAYIDLPYVTGLFGKYLNHYEDAARKGHVPLGWDKWVAFDREGYHNYKLNVDGEVHDYGVGQDTYSTAVLTDHIVNFIEDTPDEPLFVYFAPATPHFPAQYEPQDAGKFADLKHWRPAAFNERDISDKPGWVQRGDLMTRGQIRKSDQFRRDQLRSLQSLDRNVGRIIDTLEETGRLENALIMYTSDNGYSWGEHRYTGKNVPWEESIRVPLAVRWDAVIKKPRVDEHLIANIDLTPTIADIAGTPAPHVEGKSILPLLRNPNAAWREAFLIEHYAEAKNQRIPTYCAVRTDRYKYVDYMWGGDELYDLGRDPHEMQNRIDDPSMHGVLSQMRKKLASLCKPTLPKPTRAWSPKQLKRQLEDQ